MRIVQLKFTGMLAGALVIVDGMVVPGILGWSSLAPESYSSIVSPVAEQVDFAAIGLTIATMIVFGRWIYLAGANLESAGYEGLEFTPGSRIWWFAVPFANLVKPFMGMRELWNASHGELQYDRNHPLIVVWWALWIGNGLFAWITNMVTQGGDAPPALWIIQAILGLASAVLGLALLTGITRAQMRPIEADLNEVFA